MSFFSTDMAWAVVSVVAKATVLLGLGCCGMMVLRRASAAARHLAWLVVIVGVLLIPVVARVASVPAAVLPSAAPSPSVAVPPPVGAATGPGISSVAHVRAPSAGVENVAPVADARFPRPHVAMVVVCVWLGVAAALIGWLMVGMLSVRRILRGGRVMDAPEWMRTVADIAGQFGLASAPHLVMSDRVAMAFVCDVRSPTIVLPPEASAWSEDRRRAVLLHEMAHLRRHDLTGHAIARVACALYWFHPLVWLAARRLRAESERACDDLVLGSGMQASTYAQHLLDMVAGLGYYEGAPASALPMARPHEFEGRLHAILDRAKRRNVMGRAPRGAIVAIFGALAMSVAAVSPVRRAPASPPPLANLSAAPPVARAVSRPETIPSHVVAIAPHSDTARVSVTEAPAQSVAQTETPAQGVVQTASITGRVVDVPGGLPITGATVYIPTLPYKDSTGSDGKYTLKDVPYGIYDIEVRRDGYAPAHITDFHVEQSTITLDITMVKRSAAPQTVGVHGDLASLAGTMPGVTFIPASSVGANGVTPDQIRQALRGLTSASPGDTQRALRAPAPMTPFVAPLPVPVAVRGDTIVIESFVNISGLVDSVRFAPTADSVYNSKLESALRAMPFRPGVGADAAPIAMWYTMVVVL